MAIVISEYNLDEAILVENAEAHAVIDPADNIAIAVILNI